MRSIDISSLNSALKPSGPEFSLVGIPLMISSICLVIIGLFNLLIWSWLNFGVQYLSRKLSISFKFYNLVEYRFLNYDLKSLWISPVSVVISSYSVLILFVWILTLCLLVSLDKDTTLCLIDSLNCFLCFSFVDFNSQCDYFLSSCLPGWVLLL